MLEYNINMQRARKERTTVQKILSDYVNIWLLFGTLNIEVEKDL